MRECIYKNKWKMILICSMMIGIVLRIVVSFRHFTHYDDVGLLATLLQLGDQFRDRLGYRAIGWTYAPLQVGIISALIQRQFHYETNLILGRLPSLLFSICNLFLAVRLGTRISKDKKAGYVQMSVLILLALSWENLIYGAQAEPYAIGVTAMFLLTIACMKIIEKRDFHLVSISVLGAVVCYASYQMYAYCFCFFISLYAFGILWRNKVFFIKSILASVMSLILCLPALKQFFLYGLLEKGVNPWNMGIFRQYVYSLEGVSNPVLYTILFFIKNTIRWFRSFFVYKEGNVVVHVIVILLIATVLYGYYVLHKENRYLAVYVDLCLVLTFGMMITGKLTFSPSRHTMILIPLVLLLTGTAISHWMVPGVREGKICCSVWGVCLCMVVFIFSIGFKNEYTGRVNRISELLIHNQIETYDPGLICFYGNTLDLDLIQADGYTKILNGGVLPQCIQKKGQSIKEGDVVIFFSRTREIREDDLNLIAESLNGYHLKLTDQRCIGSNVEVEYAANVFQNDRNGYFYYLYEVVS